MGAAVSIGNPYFALWWATVGLGLLGSAARLGRPAVACFYVGHVLSDFAWFAFVAGSLALGRSVIVGGPAYRVLLMASGVFLVGFGLYFAIVRRRGEPASG
jgi:threonine/homoserine/homoserine lactone efflux protein